MTDIEQKTLLICHADDCDERFVSEVDKDLEGDMASLPAAMQAHKAGWVIAEGQIFCPKCAEKLNKHPLH